MVAFLYDMYTAPLRRAYVYMADLRLLSMNVIWLRPSFVWPSLSSLFPVLASSISDMDYNNMAAACIRAIRIWPQLLSKGHEMSGSVSPCVKMHLGGAMR